MDEGLCSTAIYLPWLVVQILRNGVVLKRAVLSEIRQVKGLSHTSKPATIIINATGLRALKLGGVRDTKMMPVRGQVVLVRNEVPMIGTSVTDLSRVNSRAVVKPMTPALDGTQQPHSLCRTSELFTYPTTTIVCPIVESINWVRRLLEIDSGRESGRSVQDVGD